MNRIKDLINKTLYIMTRPQKILCVIVFILTCIGSGLECLGVSVIVPLVGVIQDPNSLPPDSLIRRMDFMSDASPDHLVMIICGGVIIVYLIKNVYFIFLSWIRIKFSCKIQRELSVKMLRSYLSRGYQYFLNNSYGEFSWSVSGDTGAVYEVLSSGFRFMSELLTITLISIFMLFTDWIMAISIILLAMICLGLIYFVFRKNMYKAGEENRKFTSKSYQTLVQAFEGAKDVLLLRKQSFFIHEYEAGTIGAQNAQCKRVVGAESPAFIIEGICISGIMIIVASRILIVGNDPKFIAVLAAFAVGAFRILPSLGKISVSINSLTASLPSINSLYQNVIETEEYAAAHPEAIFDNDEDEKNVGSSLIDRHGAKVLNRTELITGEKFKSSLVLKDVSFGYNDEVGDILTNINLEIKKGQSIAFIGASGAGKSTLVDVLLGLLIPRIGGIYMDGVKITDIPDKWAQTIGYVPQSVFLSDATIKENVAFGESIDELDEERVIDALKRAELWDFINELPDGLETYVGDRGVRLSGGQRQRIAIARALYHRPEIMVLDEATSALDNETEEAVMSAIDALQGHVTLIIVAHRLTTIKNCDLIYEVKDKSISKRNKQEVI